MSPRPAVAPRTGLVVCGHKPTHHAVIDGPAFVADFAGLLRKHGVEPGDMSTASLAEAEGLVVLAATMLGAQADMPLSLFRQFDAVRSKVGVRPVEADRRVA